MAGAYEDTGRDRSPGRNTQTLSTVRNLRFHSCDLQEGVVKMGNLIRSLVVVALSFFSNILNKRGETLMDADGSLGVVPGRSSSERRCCVHCVKRS